MEKSVDKKIQDFKSLNEVLLYYAECIEDERIFIGSSSGVTPYTNRDVLTLSNKVINALRELNIKENDRVLIILPTSIEFVYSFFGVLLSGGIPVPLAPQNIGASNLTHYLARIRHIIENCNPEYVILDEKQIRFNPLKEMLDEFKNLEVINVSGLEQLHEKPEYFLPDTDDICLIQYTSGSTGAPKGVPITHRNLIINIDAISKGSLVTKKDSCVSWLPLYHDMGLIGGFLVPYVNGIPALIFPPELFIFKPLLWLKFISDYKATISPGNNFSLAYCIKRIKDEVIKDLDLSSWRVAYNGSEPISMDVVNEFYNRFACTGYRQETMLPCYGLAEGTLAVTFSSASNKPTAARFNRDSIYKNGLAEEVSNDDYKNSIELVSVGTAVSNVNIKLVDENGNEVGEGQVGEILIKGQSVFKGYYSDRDEEMEKYLKDGWYYTGDLGFLHNNELYIAGRKKELVIIRGKNYSPVDIENVIIERLESKIGKCVAFGYQHPHKGEEVLAIIYESKKSSEDFVSEMKESIENIVLNEFNISVENVIRTDKIPKTLNGKIMRTECYPKYILNAN